MTRACITVLVLLLGGPLALADEKAEPADTINEVDALRAEVKLLRTQLERLQAENRELRDRLAAGVATYKAAAEQLPTDNELNDFSVLMRSVAAGRAERADALVVMRRDLLRRLWLNSEDSELWSTEEVEKRLKVEQRIAKIFADNGDTTLERLASDEESPAVRWAGTAIRRDELVRRLRLLERYYPPETTELASPGWRGSPIANAATLFVENNKLTYPTEWDAEKFNSWLADQGIKSLERSTAGRAGDERDARTGPGLDRRAESERRSGSDRPQRNSQKRSNDFGR